MVNGIFSMRDFYMREIIFLLNVTYDSTFRNNHIWINMLLHRIICV